MDYIVVPSKTNQFQFRLHTHYIKLMEELVDNILVTRSHKGMSLINKHDIIHIDTTAKDVFDVCGAGDTVVAALSLCVAKNIEINTTLNLCNKAAGIVIGKFGTQAVNINDLFDEVDNIKVITDDDKINFIKNKDKKIVFTNGVFDILHRGHLEYLSQAKLNGDILIIGLNSDASVKKIKGPSRPINSQADRAYMLSCLKFVDYIIIFDEETPYHLIKKIKPDVLIKGSDYSIDEIVGKEFSKEVKVIDFIKGYSTTNFINKLKK